VWGKLDIYERQREALQTPGSAGTEEAFAIQLSDAIERALPDERCVPGAYCVQDTPPLLPDPEPSAAG
jgi:hypothetical protein